MSGPGPTLVANTASPRPDEPEEREHSQDPVPVAITPLNGSRFSPARPRAR